jgi:hypothetical protein
LSLSLFGGAVHPQNKLIAPGPERARKWREDLQYFKERFPVYDKTLTPLYYPNHADSGKLYYAVSKNSLETFLRGVDSLYQNVENLSDEEIMIGMCRMVGLSFNGHTRLYLFRVRTILNNLPIGLYWFGEDLHITAAPKAYRDLPGAKIIAINGIALDSVRKAVDKLIAGNSSWKSYMSLYFLRSPQTMKGLSLGTASDSMQLTVITAKGKKQEVRMKGDFVLQTEPQEIWKNLSPNMIKKDSLVHVLQGQELPLYLKYADSNYHYAFLKKDGTVYLQFNRVEDAKSVSFNDYVSRLVQDLKEAPFTKFVLDLRFNTGGNNDIATRGLAELVSLVKAKGCRSYIITGIATFSAGVTTAAKFKYVTGATIIGAPAGDGLVYLSEGGNVILPNSKLFAHYANGLHDEVFEKGFTIRPDKEIYMDFTDYRSGTDPVMDFILADK